MAAEAASNPLAALFPSHGRHWLPLMEDIAFSDALSDKLKSIYLTLEEDEEWLYVSVDATLRICMKLKGQESYRKPKRVRDDAPFGDDTAWRKLLTVRGRSGAVLMMKPVISERTEDVCEAFLQDFSSSALNMIRFVATDCPSSKFFDGMRDICPNLEGMCLDPIHLAIVYEYAQWNKRTPGSKQLRRVLHKIICVSDGLSVETWDALYTGTEERPLGRDEEAARSQILNLSMSKVRARKLLDELDYETPFVARVSFIRALAAICCLYDREVSRKVTGANKEVYKVLWSACAPDRIEWLFNNTRVRHMLSGPRLILLPSGTSSNEALHAEINSWTRSINSLHRSTLCIKLRFVVYRKLLAQAHYMAVCFPFGRITCESVVLARSLMSSIWTDSKWATWCSSQRNDEVQHKASTPLANARTHESNVVREWAAKKRPAGRQRKEGRRVKRTPLNLPRSHTLKASGIRPRK